MTDSLVNPAELPSTNDVVVNYTIRHNGLFLTVRENSQTTRDEVLTHALDWANQVSQHDPDLGWYVLRFDARSGAFGITYSERLKRQLGLGQYHYDMVSGYALSATDLTMLHELLNKLNSAGGVNGLNLGNDILGSAGVTVYQEGSSGSL